MSKPRALDLYCGAGGVSVGLARAGFDVVGCDIKYSKNYPFPMIVCDALEIESVLDLTQFQLIWASPPCQKHSWATPKSHRDNHPCTIAPTREILARSGALTAIENVQKAPIRADIILDGVHFGLPLERRRIFEVNFPSHDLRTGPRGRPHNDPSSGPQDGPFPWLQNGPTTGAKNSPDLDRENGPESQGHFGIPQAVYVSGGTGAGKGSLDDWKRAMGIDWMSRRELTEAIPPIYAQSIAECALNYLDTSPLKSVRSRQAGQHS